MVSSSARASDAPATADEALAPIPAVHAIDARPSGLMASYVAHVALQSFDIYSTLSATRRSGSEQNPVVGGLLGHPTAFVALKGAVAGAAILTAEELWRRGHRGHAIALMAVSNGLMAAVAANNVAALRR